MLPQHGLDFDVVLETSVDEVDGASQHADGRVAEGQVEGSEEIWNTRIFRIKKAATINSVPAATPTAEQKPTARKEKKGKIPCAKEKRGRIR